MSSIYCINIKTMTKNPVIKNDNTYMALYLLQKKITIIKP